MKIRGVTDIMEHIRGVSNRLDMEPNLTENISRNKLHREK